MDLAFDATTWTPCRRMVDEDFGQCSSGVLRMGDGEASVVIEDPPGATFTINFLKQDINSGRGAVKATLDGKQLRGPGPIELRAGSGASVTCRGGATKHLGVR